MITLTEKARENLIKQGAGHERFLRIKVKSGGCAGMTYDAEIDDTRFEDESVVQKDSDLTIVSDKESMTFLEGLCIDYSDDLISAGFRFTNSSNDSSCGCGASFALAGFPQLKKGGAAVAHNPIPILGGKSVHCINEQQMAEAMRLAEEDSESSPKIQARLRELEAELSRNELAALAFVIIQRLKSSSPA